MGGDWNEPAWRAFDAKMRQQAEYCEAHPKIDPFRPETWDQTFLAMVGSKPQAVAHETADCRPGDV